MQKALVLAQGEVDTPVEEQRPDVGVSQATAINQKKGYGGQLREEERRQKSVEDENARLRTSVPNPRLDRKLLEDVIRQEL